MRLAGCVTLVLIVGGVAPGVEWEPETLLRLRTELCPRPLPQGSAPERRTGRISSPAAAPRGAVRRDFPCNDDTIGGSGQYAPAVATALDGSFTVAWYDFREGDADVWFQRFDPLGGPIGRNERLNSDSAMRWQDCPAVAYAPEGRLIGTWMDRREIGNSDVFGQYLDPAGGPLGVNFRVSDSAAAGDQMVSGCWISPSGLALVAWDDRRFGITGDIFAQFLAPDGSPQDTNLRVNDDPVGLANQYEPVVGGDSSGRFVVAWMDGRGLNWKDWNIHCQRFGPDGERLGSNIQVTANDSIQWIPGLAVAPSGRFLICWEDQRTGQQSDVYARVFGADGQPLRPEFLVNDDGGSQDQSGVAAAATSNGEFLVVWSDRRSGDLDVYAQRVSAAGAKLGSNFRVSDESPTDQGTPAAAGTPDDGYIVAWVDGRNGHEDVFCQRLSVTGGRVGGNLLANDDGASSHQRVSSIAMTSRGRAVVAWEDERSEGTDAYCVLLDSAGFPLGQNLKLNDDPGIAAQYYCAASAGRDRMLVTWLDGRGGDFDIYGQWLDDAGSPIGSNRRINSDVGEAQQWYSFAAMDTSNRSVVVWTDYRGANCETYCRLFDSTGNALGPEFRVTDDSASQYYGSVAVNASGRFVVTWMDYRNGDADIYCQAYRTDGSRIGGNIRVSDDVSGSYQGYPVAAVFDDGDFAIAWEETRNERYDIYLQWYDSSGSPVGDNVMVNDQVVADVYSPSLACDRSGRLAVMFNDEREAPGAPDIYCQRFLPDRAREGNNLRVNEPRQFSKNSHWTIGQSVAASNEVLAFAWTDNRRRQGWDIFARLSDWDLVGVAEPTKVDRMPAWPVNPTIVAGRVHLTLPGSSPTRRALVFDGVGRRVLQARAPDSNITLDVDALASGVYTIVVEDGPTRVRGRIIVR